jgi:proteasome activator subunit 4
MGYIAENSRRFFHPAAINEMLSTFLPLVDGTKLDVRVASLRVPGTSLTLFQSILSSHFYLTTFLPLSHPQYYLPMMFRVWESINSYMYDERMLHFLSKLAEMHVVPEVSDPKRIEEIPDDERSEGESRPEWLQASGSASARWTGLYKDVGIFSEHEWSMLMCKCLASMGKHGISKSHCNHSHSPSTQKFPWPTEDPLLRVPLRIARLVSRLEGCPNHNGVFVCHFPTSKSTLS